MNGTAGAKTKPPPTSTRAETLESQAEEKAASAVIQIVEGGGSGSTPSEHSLQRVVEKRVKAINKKLTKIASTESLPHDKLNEDQKRTLASKDALVAVLKELNEVLVIVQQESQQAAASAVIKASSHADQLTQTLPPDTSGALGLKQFLTLFAAVHAPGVVDAQPVSASDDDKKAIAILYRRIAAGDDGASLSSAHADEKVGDSLTVTFGRIRDLAISATTKKHVVDTTGISFLQSSEVEEPVDADSEQQAQVNGIKEDEPTLEPEGGVVDAAPVVAGEASQVGASGAMGSVLGEPHPQAEREAESKAAPEKASASAPVEAASQAPPPAPASRTFDWSADVDDDDIDLGDPSEMFGGAEGASKKITPPAAAAAEDEIEKQHANSVNGQTGAPAPSPRKQRQRQGTNTSNSGTTNPNRRPQNQPRPAAPVPESSTSSTASAPPKKGPIVDEDGFVLQTSKKSLHYQQQQQQQQSGRGGRGGRGGGRGRGRGAGRGGRGRGGGASGSEQQLS